MNAFYCPGTDSSSSEPINRLIADIAKAINGEYQAIGYYEALARLAPTEKERTSIREIRRDEIKHYKRFLRIYKKLTGHKPMVTKGSLPENYRQGLKFSIEDELETVDFYLDISDRAFDPHIRRTFRRAALDGQQHAVTFNYFLTKLCCKDP